jgi:hypothetical protein
VLTSAISATRAAGSSFGRFGFGYHNSNVNLSSFYLLSLSRTTESLRCFDSASGASAPTRNGVLIPSVPAAAAIASTGAAASTGEVTGARPAAGAAMGFLRVGCRAGFTSTATAAAAAGIGTGAAVGGGGGGRVAAVAAVEPEAGTGLRRGGGFRMALASLKPSESITRDKYREG